MWIGWRIDQKFDYVPRISYSSIFNLIFVEVKKILLKKTVKKIIKNSSKLILCSHMLINLKNKSFKNNESNITSPNFITRETNHLL